MKIYAIQFINYTLSFLMWMIIGRGILTLISGSRRTFLTGLFEKITDPVYSVTSKIFPFAKDRWIPFFSVLLIIVIRLAMIIVFHPATGQK